ncbi:unnamed protein product [Didymodactylos carnosus]|uniref:Microtubule-associated protein Jupiter n=1 Tax=Didymodactylos carnosus TaxID=1234261 RepID=A0A813X9Y6_9BILA|nr:unnamed protein product [Didymodactylos carnosus]CAF0865215.1 unnamed protein product [Didymodactylos carnosus]CAF3582401.1 unnamed protein product [Didymodactylos carnosus]CAF3652724.1 unnamed protein product [Didymodactylos carnosus]
MSGVSKDHTSVRVVAPPGGKSFNIFGTSEQEQAQTNKKNHMVSDIFGLVNNGETQKSSRGRDNSGIHIFGGKDETDHVVTKSSTVYSDKNKSNIFDGPQQQQQTQTTKPDRQRSNIFNSQNEINEINHQNNNREADLHKQNQMRSNIFGTNDSNGNNDHVQKTAGVYSEKNKSNIFGNNNENDQKKTGRQGIRVGYNCITGEYYNTNKNLDVANEKKQQVSTTNDVHDQNGADNHDAKENSKDDNKIENGTTLTTAVEQDLSVNGSDHTPNENSEMTTNGAAAQATTNGADIQHQQQTIHTVSRVLQPPGGKSHGRLW